MFRYASDQSLYLDARPDTVDLGGCHSVAGNPMRFRTGPTRLRADEEWRTAMPAADRRLVTAMSWPLLRRFGYR